MNRAISYRPIRNQCIREATLCCWTSTHWLGLTSSARFTVLPIDCTPSMKSTPHSRENNSKPWMPVRRSHTTGERISDPLLSSYKTTRLSTCYHSLNNKNNTVEVFMLLLMDRSFTTRVRRIWQVMMRNWDSRIWNVMINKSTVFLLF